MSKQTNKTTLSYWLMRKALTGFKVVLFLVAVTGVFLYTRVGAPERVQALTPMTLNFQARLLNGSGGIVPDGKYNVQFKLYDAQTAGNLLWTETRNDTNGVTAGNDFRVDVKSGYLSVYLGDVNAFGSINWDQQLYLTMNIGGTNQVTPSWDGEMSPRLRLTSVPYAVQASRAEQLAKQVSGFSAQVLFPNTLGQNTNYLLPDPGTTNATICLTTGNCSGSGTGVTAASPGTAGYLSRFTAGQDIASSVLFQDDTTDVLEVDSGYDFSLLGGDLSVVGDVSVTGNSTFTGFIDIPASTTPSLSATDVGRLYFDTNDNTIKLSQNGGNFYDICTTGGNCAGSGSGVTALGTTAGFIPVLTGTQQLGNSMLFQDDVNDALEVAPTYDFVVEGGDLLVTGGGTFSGLVTANGGLAVGSNSNFNQTGTGTFGTGTGAVSLNGATSVTGSNTFTVGTGATSLGGTLGVTGATTLQSTLAVQGPSVTVGGAAQTGSVIINDGSGQTATITPANLTQSTSYQLPDVNNANAVFCVMYGSGQNNCAGQGNAVDSLNGLQGDLTILGTANEIQVSASTPNITIGLPDDVTIGDDLTVTDVLSSASLAVTNNATVGGTLGVTGASTFTGLGTFNGGVTVAGITNINTTGTAATNIGNAGSTTAVLGTVNINSTGSGTTTVGNSGAALTLQGSSLVINAPTITRTVAGTTTLDFVDSANTTLALTNSGAGVANFTVDGAITAAGLFTANGGVTVANNSNFNQTGTGTFSTGTGVVSLNGSTVNVSSLAAGGLVKANVTTGELVLAVSGTDYETGLTFANGLTRTGNAVSLGGNLTSGTTIGLNGSSLTFDGSAGDIVIASTGVASFGAGIVVDANQTISLTGGITANRPASPTEGMLYFDTDTNSLLVYANGKWQADRTSVTKTVAPSNASQAIKDSADYVADGTGDQTEINAALTAAAGGKVYLFEGTFVANATILIPNNTTLAGSGNGTLIQLASSVNLIENSDTTTGTGVVIQDLRLDGSLNTGGTNQGIYLNGVGSTSRNSGRIGNVIASGFISNGAGIYVANSFGVIISGNESRGNVIGFHIVGSSATKLVNNTAASNSSHGIRFQSASSNIVMGNTVINNTQLGIRLLAASNVNTISGNLFQTNGLGAVAIDTSDANTVSGNTIYDNGGTGANSSIHVITGDSNLITSNRITDTAGTAYAIDITSSTSDGNYIADNYFSGTGSTSMQDLGTGTIYGGQVNGSGNYVIQPAGTIELVGATNITGNLTVSGTSTFTGLATFNGGLTVETGDTFTMNGDAFTDLTGTGLTISGGALQTTLGTSVDLTTEVTGTLPVGSGGTGATSLTGILLGNGTSPFTALTTSAGLAGAISDETGTGNLVFSASPTFTGTLTAADITASGTITANVLSVTTNATIGGTLGVTGNTTLSGDLAANGNTSIGNASTDRLTVTAQISGAAPFAFQGATDNGFATTFAFSDPTANNTITFGDETGTVCTTAASAACTAVYAAAGGSFVSLQPSSPGTPQTGHINITGTAIVGSLLVNNNATITGDLAINGDDITSDGNLSIQATGYVRIGDTGTPGVATGDDDLYIEGDLEVDANVDIAGTLQATGAVTFTGGATITGNTAIATTAGNTVSIGNATGALTVTGSNASTFVLNGITVDATEFNRLDGKDAALLDVNDAVTTAIVGTGALNSGSITSGFGAIDTGADNITTTGTVTSGTLAVTGNADIAGTLFAGTGDAFQVTSGGLVRTANGSIAAPAYSFTGATGYGLSYNGGTALILSIAGNNELAIDGGGILLQDLQLRANDGDQVVAFTDVATAVNRVNISNSAAGNAVTVGASGNDTNVGINVTPKGSGTIELQANTNVTGNLDVSGTFTSGTSNAFTINTSGAITAATGITSSGSITFSGLTADRLVATTTGGQLSNTISAANLAASVTGTIGTGNLVFSASPTFTGTVTTAALSATTINASGLITATTLGAADTDAVVCRNTSNQLATCNSTFATTGSLAGYVQLAPASAQTDNSANASIFINDTAGGNLMQLQAGGVNQFVVDNSGNVTAVGSLTAGTGLTVTSGGITATGNSTITGTLSGLTGLTSSGTITFSGLTANRLVATTTGGQLSNTISAANLAASVTGTTGTGNLVFSASPTFTGTVTLAALNASGNVDIDGTLTVGSAGQLVVDASGNLDTAGNVEGTVINATTGFRVNGAATTGNYLRGNGTNFISSALMASDLSGTIFSSAADTGTGTFVTGDTISVQGGTNGIDTTLSGDTFTLNIDTTEIGTTTFGSGTGFTWTFDAGATDPTIAFASDALTVTAATTTLTGDLAINGGDITSSGALTIAPNAGSNLNVNLSGAGDFAVNTNQLYVDTSTGNVGIGTTTPGEKLEVVGNIISKGTQWTSRTSAADNGWRSVTYGNGLFVAVARTGTGNRVMTSPDGITWTLRTTPADNDWRSVTYGNGLFVAVASTGTGNRVMTSPDGITWTSRTPAADNSWHSVTYGNGLFVAVASTGTGNRVMTSPDGITWTLRTSATDNEWRSVTYGNGLFVALAVTGTGNRVMTSPDGITWTLRTSPADNSWLSVTYGNGLFVAVANTGTNNRVMTSPDGITWTLRTSAADIEWHSVIYGNGLFVVVAGTGTDNRVMTSPDGITWSIRTTPDNNWISVTYGNGLFVAVSDAGTGNRVMTSGKQDYQVTPHNNIYQGGMTVTGNITFSGLTADRLVATTTGGQLTNTISAANLAASVTGTTGTGNLVFSASPTFTGTVTTAAISATTINASGLITATTLGTADTDTVLCRNTSNQLATCTSTFATTTQFNTSFVQNGNSFGADAVLGTNDNRNLSFETNGTTKLTVLAEGNVGIGTTGPTEKLEVNGNTMISGSLTASSLNSSAGGIGRYQNLLLRSEELENSSWTKDANVTVTANQASAPDGSTTAEQINYTSSANENSFYQNSIAAASDTFTFSVWARSVSGTSMIRLFLRETAGSSPGGTFRKDVVVDTVWRRYSITGTFSSATGNVSARLSIPGGTAASIYAWGGQLEQSSQPNVYVRTNASNISSVTHGLVVNATGASIFQGGNVGIGTSDPGSYRLNVQGGDVNFSGNLAIGGTTRITSAGVLQNVSYNGASIADAYLDDAITISSAGSVDWTALTNYPTACTTGQAVTAVGDTLTCSTFAANDTNTTYSAGNDLDLTGTTFDLESQLDFVNTINQTAANLTLQTTTTGNIVLNSADTIELQDNTNITGALSVSNGLTVSAGGASITGNTTIATTAGNTLGLGNATGTLTVTGSSASTFVLNGITITAAEFNLLDGKDAALVDVNDAVTTVIVGTGALDSGSITSGFGSIDTGADNITTTGTVQGGIVNATTGFRVNGTATTGNYLRGNGTNFVASALLASDLSGTIFNTAADTGTGTFVTGDTISVQGGTNGIDTALTGDAYTINLDTTEIGTTTFGAGSGFTWTFNAGATDPTIAFADNVLTVAAGTVDLIGTVRLGSSTTGLQVTNAGIISDLNGEIVLDDTVYIGSATTGLQVTTDGVINDIDDADISILDNLSVTGTTSVIATSSGAFVVQNSGATETILSVDTTARGAGGGNLVKIGNSTGTDTATTVLRLDSATADVTSNVSALNGGLYYYNSGGSSAVRAIINGSVVTLCDSSGNCAGAGTTLQTAYNNSIASPEIKLDSTRGALTIQDADTTIGANTNLFELLSSNAASTLFRVQGDGDVLTAGDFAVNGGDITSTGNLTVNATGYVRIGDFGTPGVANGDDDLYIEGDLEVDANVNFAGTLTFNGVATDLTTATNEDLTVVATGTGVINLNDSITAGGDITFAAGATRTLGVQTQTILNTAGNNLRVVAATGNGTGAGGTAELLGGTGGATGTGGAVSIQGGVAGGGNNNGGAITLVGGAGTGTGTQGLINLSTTAFTSAAVQTFGSAGVFAITAGNVDNYSSLPITASVTNVTVTVPDPAQSVIGRVIYIAARSGSSDFTLRLNSARTPIDIAMKQNSTATLIWNGTDWTAAGASSSTDLQSAYNNTLTSAGGAEIVLNPSGGAADGFTIRNNGTTPIVGGIFEVQSSIGTNFLSVNNFGIELAANGGSENSTTFATDWTAAPAGGTVTRTTTAGQFVTGLAGTQVVTAGTNYGVRNNLTGNPTVSTTYQVSFTGKLSSGTFSTLQVMYSRDGGTDLEACTNYSTQTLLTTDWAKVTCTITTDATTATNPDLIIRQTDATGRTFWIDNLSFVRNDSSTQPSNVQIGGGINGGQVTLFTLDRSSAPPVSNGNTTYLGSMYYDTTTGRIQCYEADGWGACGSAPDNIITLTPEYSGAVLNGTGIGTMTADFCANQAGVLTVGSLCASGNSRQFYKWTSPQATQQTYSIYVSFKLPNTFKTFNSDSTITLTALTDSTTNGFVTYQAFRSSGSAVTACGSETSVTSTVNTWQTVGINGNETSCGFVGGDNIIFKINVKANSNATVYVENLNFTYTNN